MALCFGEIEEKSSRAFWEEEDEFDDELQNTHFPDRPCKIVWMTDKNVLQYKFEVLIIVDGSFMKGIFEQGVVAKAEIIAKVINIKCTNKTNASANKTDVMGQIFLLNDKDKKALVCVCEPNLDITNTFFFTKEIFPLLMLSKEVIVLTSRSVSSYFHNHKQELPLSFLRRLQTDSYSREPVCERLEQPNIVSGVSAQVLSWCQVYNLPAILYICYTESDEIDSVTTKPIAQMLSRLKFANMLLNVADLHSVSSVKNSSLLYM